MLKQKTIAVADIVEILRRFGVEFAVDFHLDATKVEEYLACVCIAGSKYYIYQRPLPYLDPCIVQMILRQLIASLGPRCWRMAPSVIYRDVLVYLQLSLVCKAWAKQLDFGRTFDPLVQEYQTPIMRGRWLVSHYITKWGIKLPSGRIVLHRRKRHALEIGGSVQHWWMGKIISTQNISASCFRKRQRCRALVDANGCKKQNISVL